MTETKVFRIINGAAGFPAVALAVNPTAARFARHGNMAAAQIIVESALDARVIFFGRLALGARLESEPFAQAEDGPAMVAAHLFIRERWASLRSGSAIDVSDIREPCASDVKNSDCTAQG